MLPLRSGCGSADDGKRLRETHVSQRGTLYSGWLRRIPLYGGGLEGDGAPIALRLRVGGFPNGRSAAIVVGRVWFQKLACRRGNCDRSLNVRSRAPLPRVGAQLLLSCRSAAIFQWRPIAAMSKAARSHCGGKIDPKSIQKSIQNQFQKLSKPNTPQTLA